MRVLLSHVQRANFKVIIVGLVLIAIIASLLMNQYIAATSQSSEEIRQPSYAGSWYIADSTELNKQLSEYLLDAEKVMVHQPVDKVFGDNEPASHNILALVVPHAGYAYSGRTAAFAYEKLKGMKFKRVFLLGPSHHVAFSGAALPVESVFATPLGDLPIDRQIVDELCQQPGFQKLPQVHAVEHSLEMQLPFIVKALGPIKIVPIAIGLLASEADMRFLGQILRRYIEKDDLVIVSSDFTHYGPRFQYQPFVENIQENIKQLDGEAFQCLKAIDLLAFINFHNRTHDTICGYYPCSVLLSMLPSQTHATLLQYRTSQEIVPDPEHNSVSYMAIVFSEKASTHGWGHEVYDANQQGKQLSPTDGQALLKIARLALQDHLLSEKTDYASTLTKEQLALFSEPRGAFVTLFKRSEKNMQSARRDGWSLRGCIGYIMPIKPLLQAVCDNAVSAASRDQRFSPVTKDELPDLQIEISVLTSPKPIKSWQEIKLGQDGIIMHKGELQAVFLPSVATEFGWNLEQTLTQLSIKAGAGPDGWREGTIFDVFQAQSFEEHE